MTNVEIAQKLTEVMTDLKFGHDMVGKVPTSLLATHVRSTRVKLTHLIRAMEEVTDGMALAAKPEVTK